MAAWLLSTYKASCHAWSWQEQGEVRKGLWGKALPSCQAAEGPDCPLSTGPQAQERQGHSGALTPVTSAQGCHRSPGIWE